MNKVLTGVAVASSEVTGKMSSGSRIPRILVDATAGISGGKAYINELFPKLIDALPGTEWIIYGELTPELAALATRGNVEVHAVDFPKPKRSLILSSFMKLLWRQIVLPFHAVRLRPSVLFTTANFFSRLFTHFKIPCVLAIHNLTPFHEPQWYRESHWTRRWRQQLLKLLTVRSARRATRNIAFSEFARDLLLEHGVAPPKIAVIHHGTRQAQDQWIGGESDTLLVVSHYYVYKKIEVVVQALPEVWAMTGRPIKLVVQGIPYDRYYYGALSALVSRLGLDNSVMLGQGLGADKLAQLYASSRCLVFPAIGENCPITLLEAMSIGLPIVAANTRPLPEICGEAALYYDVSDYRACAAAITKVLASGSMAQNLSAVGRNRASRYFSWDVCADETARLLRVALGK